MGYGQALAGAWGSIGRLKVKGRFEVKLLSNIYTIDTGTSSITPEPTKAPPKEYTSIILLHYLARSLSAEKLPEPTGEWIDFRQINGAEGYYPAYRKRTIECLIKKHGRLAEDIKRIVRVLEGVDFMIKVSRADEEFGADAAILYDRSIEKIFCVEDIVVLTEMVVHSL